MAYEATIRIVAGKVTTDLFDFPVMVRLSSLPTAFWDAVKSDGGDIRIKTTGGTQIPQDLVRFDYTESDGVIFFKSDLLSASDNEWRISCGYPALEKIPVTDPNGRNAVWSDYESVFIMGETSGDDRTGKVMGKLIDDPETFEIIETSPDLNCHQGVCWDGTYYYTMDTLKLTKRASDWSEVSSNDHIISDAGLGDPVNHCGDPCYHDGLLWFTMACTAFDNDRWLVAFNAADLTFNRKYDYVAYTNYGASVGYCAKDGLLYLVDYNGPGADLLKVDPSDGSYQGLLTLSLAIPEVQGITWWRDYFWLSSDAYDEVVRVAYDGSVDIGNATPGYGGCFGLNTVGMLEGIGNRDNDLLLLDDPGDTEHVDVYKPYDIDKGAGGGIRTRAAGDHIRANGRGSFTTFTLGVTAAILTKSGSLNESAVSYWDESAGTANTRASIVWRYNTSIGFALWDASNTWLMSNPLVNPTIGQSYRLHAVYNGTSYRKLYVDGAVTTDDTINLLPTTLDTILIGSDDDSKNEVWIGLLGFVYLRDEVLPPEWIDTENDNLSDPDNFYEIEGVDQTIYPTEIPSEEAFGIPTIVLPSYPEADEPPTTMKAAFEVLLPPGAIWRPREGGDFDKLIDGIGANAQEVYDYIDDLARIRDPRVTPILDDLEREYGISKNATLSETIRRAALAATKYAIPNTASYGHLQARLRAAGFTNIVVTPNDPAIDPALITGSELVVNGALYSSQSPAYLMECNNTEIAYAGNGKAVCGYYINIRRNPEEYDIPVSSIYWRFFFFVGGVASGWPGSPAIAYYTVPAGRLEELKRLILRYKPVRSWCVLRAGY